MKAKLIVNPVSGTDTASHHLAVINQRLRERFETIDIALTAHEGDAVAMAASATRHGFDHVFAAGGDGTLNEVVNGVASVPGGLDRVTFGVIPLGTGNDFASALGVAPDVDAAVDVILGGHTRMVDVGRVNDRHFVNVSAGGFMADVSDSVSPELKSVTGKLAYLIGGAQVLFSYEPVGVHVVANEGAYEARLSLHTFAVCNARLIGGGRLIAPQAEIDDGLLDVCLIESMSTMEFLALLRQVSSGEHVRDERVAYFRSADVNLRFDRPLKVNTDGQVFEAEECRYRVLPRAARMFAPAMNAQAILPASN